MVGGVARRVAAGEGRCGRRGPGLGGAREPFPLPVVGLAEAGMLTACMLGRRFAIVSFARTLGPWYQECMEWHGLAGRCAGIRLLEGDFRSISDVQEEKENLLVALAKRAVERMAPMSSFSPAPRSPVSPLGSVRAFRSPSSIVSRP
jgi:hypothetical protein